MTKSESQYIVSYNDASNGYKLDDTIDFFGIQLVNTLAEQLGARLNLLNDSLTLHIPLK